MIVRRTVANMLGGDSTIPGGVSVCPGGVCISPGGVCVSPGGVFVCPGGISVIPARAELDSTHASASAKRFHLSILPTSILHDES